jgi:hypothetical protein
MSPRPQYILSLMMDHALISGLNLIHLTKMSFNMRGVSLSLKDNAKIILPKLIGVQ